MYFLPSFKLKDNLGRNQQNDLDDSYKLLTTLGF